MPRISRRRFIALASLAAAIYMVPGSVKAYNVELSRYGMGLGVRILHVADLHLHAGDRLEHLRLVETVRPDLLVLGGDTWDMATRDKRRLEEWVSLAVSASRRAIAVLGNHEYNADSRGRLRLSEGLRLLERYGVIVLRDDATRVLGLEVAGLDWRWNPEEYSEAAGSIEGMESVDLVVAHSPDVLPHLPGGRGLVLAGHTHGGQMCLPGGRGVVTNSVYGFKSGVYSMHGWTMIVSRGAGELVPPRVYCRRELVAVS